MESYNIAFVKVSSMQRLTLDTDPKSLCPSNDWSICIDTCSHVNRMNAQNKVKNDL